MTNRRHRAPSGDFASEVLPWVAGLGSLTVYLITLNRWISLQSLDIINQLSGSSWQPVLTRPLTSAILYFFKFLPQASLPLALNIFSAVCAAGVVALLARTVFLLPYSTSGETHSRGRTSGAAGWMAPLLAAAACGLELTYWEHATAISGEMVNLLIFAYIVRCLFEFRADGDERWFPICAFCYGAGMANNWGLMGFLPIFLAAMIWLKRMGFFTGRFLLRLGGWGLAGASLYLLIPIALQFSNGTGVGFWQALKANWQFETESLLSFSDWMLLVLALTILLPAIVLLICWRPEKKEEGGDNAITLFVMNGSLRAAHALFLGVSVWIALDLPFSPRKIGFGQPLLPFYYLNALIMGYCAGYLVRTGLGEFHGNSFFRLGTKLIAKVGAYWVCLLVLALPIELAVRNYPELRWTNGPAVRRFAEQLYEKLPLGKSVALSDSAEQLILLQAALAAHEPAKDAMLVDLAALPLRRYQSAMARRFGSRWPSAPELRGSQIIEREDLMNLLAKFSASERLVCLNPGFGYYQEPYVEQPGGFVHYLLPRSAGDLSLQHLDAATAMANERYWQDQWKNGVEALAVRTRLESADRAWNGGGFIGRAFLGREQNHTAAGLQNAYARAFDDWGVHLQRRGEWREAGLWFERALSLRPDSLSPHINLLFNQRHQRGETERLELREVEAQFRNEFGKYATWARVILDGGPVDEPTFLNETARVLLFGGDSQQAAADYARCMELAPGWTDGKLWFAQSLVVTTNYTRALAVTDGIQSGQAALDGSQLGQLLFCQVSALKGLGRTNEAAESITKFVHEHSRQSEVLATAVELCMRDRHFELALTLLGQLIEREPNDPQWLSNKAMVQMELSHPEESILSLTAALALAPTNQLIRMNRALTLLKAGHLEAARQDYQAVLEVSPHSRPVLFGLEEIAWQQQNRDATIGLCQRYMANSSPQSAEYKLVSNHLRSLQSPPKN